ncbi:MAG: lysylphosphatidylglycerol synthase transmembrane domain-containing protein [Candidatus Dormibacteraceae bacterium]
MPEPATLPIPAIGSPAPARRHRGRARARLILQTAAGLALLGFWVHTVPISMVWRNARPHHLWPLALIALCTLASALLRAGRWKLILRPIRDVPALDLFWINSAGNLVNYLLPLRAGDAIRFWWVGRRHPIPGGACLASMIVDKLFDLAAMVAFLVPVAGLELALHGRGDPLARVLGVAAAAPALTLIGLLAAVTLGPRLILWTPVSSRLRPGVRRTIHQQSGWFRAATSSIGGGRRLGVLGLMTGAALISDGLAFSLLFTALDIHLSYVAAMAGSIGITISYGLPAAPGYVGNVEVAGSMVLATGLGLQRAVAAGAVLLWHVLAAMMVVCLGLVALSRLNMTGPARSLAARLP